LSVGVLRGWEMDPRLRGDDGEGAGMTVRVSGSRVMLGDVTHRHSREGGSLSREA
jgi:hypothetical protein